jgi:DHA1 family multidrug resistance protein-like MFS transporter
MPTPFLPIQVQLLRGKVEGAAAIMGAISGVIGLVTAISGILLGKLGDRHPRLKLISIFALAASILVLPASVMNSIMGFTIFFVAGSFFAGGLEPLMQSHLTSLTSAENRGTLFGIQTTVGSLGWAISPLIGSVLSIHFSIPSVFVAMSGFLFLASFVARINYKKHR